MKEFIIEKVGRKVLLIVLFIAGQKTGLTEGAVFTENSKPRYQPELDQISLEEYATNESLFNLHINCLLFDGPCNSVGHWMKPRMASYFLGSCILCTPNQEKQTDQYITWLYRNHPQLFRTGIAKYLDANGITLPEDSKFREQVQKMNVPKVVVASGESSISRSVEEESDSPNAASENNNQEPEQQPQSQSQSQHQHQQTFTSSNSKQNQRINESNSRRNKFAPAMTRKTASSTSIFAQPHYHQKIYSTDVEDDEAENDFEITTQS